MGMSTGARHARDQCVHHVCIEGPDSSQGMWKGQPMQITIPFMKLGYAITIPVWLCINNENVEVYSNHI